MPSRIVDLHSAPTIPMAVTMNVTHPTTISSAPGDANSEPVRKA